VNIYSIEIMFLKERTKGRPCFYVLFLVSNLANSIFRNTDASQRASSLFLALFGHYLWCNPFCIVPHQTVTTLARVHVLHADLKFYSSQLNCVAVVLSAITSQQHPQN